MVTKRSMFALLAVGALVGCTGSDGTGADIGVDSTVTEISAPASAAESTVPTTAAPTSAETTTTVSASTTSTTSSTTTSTSAPTTTSAPATTPAARNGFDAPPGELRSPTIEIPSGEFFAAPGDLVVARSDALDYLPNALSPGSEAPPIRLAALAEMPGALVSLRDVAGIVNGSVVVGDGDAIFAIDAPGSVVGPLATGTHAEISPDGTQLATATERELNVFDVATGEGVGITFDAPDRMILDLEWIDDETLATIIDDSASDGDPSYRLARFDAATFAQSSDEVSFESDASIAGRTADGMIGVEVSSETGAVVRYFDANLAEQPALQQTFDSATPVQFVRIESDGLGQIWVDEFRLFYLGPDQFEARLLDDDVTMAWFVEST